MNNNQNGEVRKRTNYYSENQSYMFNYKSKPFKQKAFQKQSVQPKKRQRDTTPEYKGKRYLENKPKEDQQINIRHISYLPDPFKQSSCHFLYFDNIEKIQKDQQHQIISTEQNIQNQGHGTNKIQEIQNQQGNTSVDNTHENQENNNILNNKQRISILGNNLEQIQDLKNAYLKKEKEQQQQDNSLKKNNEYLVDKMMEGGQQSIQMTQLQKRQSILEQNTQNIQPIKETKEEHSFQQTKEENSQKNSTKIQDPRLSVEQITENTVQLKTGDINEDPAQKIKSNNDTIGSGSKKLQQLGSFDSNNNQIILSNKMESKNVKFQDHYKNPSNDYSMTSNKSQSLNLDQEQMDKINKLMQQQEQEVQQNSDNQQEQTLQEYSSNKQNINGIMKQPKIEIDKGQVDENQSSLTQSQKIEQELYAKQNLTLSQQQQQYEKESLENYQQIKKQSFQQNQIHNENHINNKDDNNSVQAQKLSRKNNIQLKQVNNNNLVVVYGLENPSLIKNIVQQFVYVESPEILNGWVEDFVDTTTRPTLNDIDGQSLYMTCKYISIRKEFNLKIWEKNKNENKSSTYARQKHFSFVIGRNQVQQNKMFLLVFLEDSNKGNAKRFISYIDEVFELITKRDKRYYQSLDNLLFRFIDKIVENYTIILEKFDKEVLKKLDEEVILTNPQKDTLKKIHIAKSECLEIKYAVQPLKDILKKIKKRNSLYNNDTENFLTKQITGSLQRQQSLGTQMALNQEQPIKMLQDEILDVMDTIDQFAEILQNQNNIYLSNVSNITNDIMKFLTLISAVFIPLSFLSGFYGMNFKYMPELEYEGSYFILVGIMLFIAFSILMFFKLKKWI